MNVNHGGRAADCWKQTGTWGDRSCPELPPQVHCRNCAVYSAGAARLLDAELPATDLVTRAGHYAASKTVENERTLAVVVFRIGAEWLALPASVWREVVTLRPVHSLPHRRDPVVTGVVNIHGELLVCVSLAAALGAELLPAGSARRLAVVQHGAEPLVFLADEIAGLHRCDPAGLAPPPATLARAQLACLRGMIPWENRSAGLLDEDRMFQLLTRSLA